jgi:tRNA(adenine34) deaminase
MLTDFDNTNEFFMRAALKAAVSALSLNEVPIGACIASDSGQILAVAGNRTRTDCDPTAHAEILALRAAAKFVGNYRLTEMVIYSTIEPCAMCAGALVQARIKKLVYGAPDERFGAVRSRFELCDSSSLNHQIEIVSGILEPECRNLMQSFFQGKRQGKKG